MICMIFVFTYVKIHFISKAVSILSKCSQLVSITSYFFNSSSGWSLINFSIILPRTDVQSTIVQVGYLTRLARSHNTATALIQF